MSVISTTLLWAVLMVPGPGTAPEPSCRAQLKGPRLTTTIQFQNGYALQAPWRVVETRRAWVSASESNLVVELALDRIEEFDDVGGAQKTTHLEAPVRITVQGATETEVVYQAAETWCNTVIRTRSAQAAASSQLLARPGRIT